MASIGARLPWTRIKLFIAGALYRLLRLFLKNDVRLITRGGIRYKVDLSEAIDFTLFLTGGFQSYVFRNPHLDLPEDAVVLDVGANIGSMTLPFARQAPRGRVYAFEPTDRAFQRLRENLSLNPALSDRIEAVQAFLSHASGKRHGLAAFSSWKIDRARPGRHPLHGGLAQPADDVPAYALDDFVGERGLRRLDLVKIDTEGHELAILRGARKTLERLRPRVIFELGLYTLQERGIQLKDYFDVLLPLGYRWIDLKTGRSVTPENASRQVPARSTTDILAIPS